MNARLGSVGIESLGARFGTYGSLIFVDSFGREPPIADTADNCIIFTFLKEFSPAKNERRERVQTGSSTSITN